MAGQEICLIIFFVVLILAIYGFHIIENYHICDRCSEIRANKDFLCAAHCKYCDEELAKLTPHICNYCKYHENKRAANWYIFCHKKNRAILDEFKCTDFCGDIL